ncbi:MAG: outer membrane beta-barrel protein [Saprospiraceae bacterium]|nr:outer membrane beta-barrel protein [Saprospiraceae bacterium]
MKLNNLFVLFLSGLLWSQSVAGQILDRGNFLVGTNVGFSRAQNENSVSSSGQDVKGEGPSSTQFNIAPDIGYFLADNFVLGIGLDYTLSSVKQPNEDRTTDSDLLFGPFGRYYFPLDNDMAVFFVTTFGFGNSSDETLIGTNTKSVNTNILAIGAGPGFTIFSSSGIGIEAILKYNYARSTFDTEDAGVKITTKSITNQFDIGLGIQFYFSGLKRVGS